MVKNNKQFSFKNLDKSKIVLYSKDDCKWCLLLKVLFKNHNVQYTEKIISSDEFDQFKKKYEKNTLPQLYVDNNCIGGYNSCRELVKPEFDYKLLHKVTKIVTRNLNSVIDINFYPTNKTKNSNLKHRPIGIGVQGLADAFALLDIPFHSEEAKQVNKLIFETIYHAAIETSMEISKERKKCNEKFKTFLYK